MGIRSDTLAILFALTMSGCGQDKIVWPDQPETGGLCGAWYPPKIGETDTEGDAGQVDQDIYGVEEGMIFPCLVWESVMVDNKMTYVNVGEEYLKTQHSLSDKKAIVIAVVAKSCPTCPQLLQRIVSRQEQLSRLALVYGVAFTDFNELSIVLTLNEAVQVVVSEASEEGDGWPTDIWPITDDLEKHLRSVIEGFPFFILVNMRTMRVHTAKPGSFESGYHFNNVDELIATIEQF